MIDTWSPLRTPSSCSPKATYLTFCRYSDQWTSFQMPRSLYLNATLSGCNPVILIKALGSVSISMPNFSLWALHLILRCSTLLSETDFAAITFVTLYRNLFDDPQIKLLDVL